MSDNQNPEAVKSSLLKARWRTYKTITVEGESGAVELVVRRPPPKFILRALKQMEADGLVDAKHNAVSEEAGLVVSARLIAPMLYLPNAREQLFTPEELIEAAWFMEVLHECLPALGATKGMVEAATGN